MCCPRAQGILREHVLPRLARLGNAALWLHFVEQAVAFERALAPLRGLPPAPADVDAAGETTQEPWVQGSCLELLPTQPARSLSPSPNPYILETLKNPNVGAFLWRLLCAPPLGAGLLPGAAAHAAGALPLPEP